MSGSLPEYNSGPSSSTHSSEQHTSQSLDILESHVDIIDTGQLTTISLQLCRKLVLQRYHKLLIFIGWKQFGQKRMFFHPRLWKFLNYAYLLFVIISLVYSYIYEILFCDGQVATYSTPSESRHEVSDLTTTVQPQSPLYSNRDSGDDTDSLLQEMYGLVLQSLETKRTAEVPVCHEITIYAIPNVVQLVAFGIGFWHFRISENEELDALIERVFLQTQQTFGIQEKLVLNAKWFLISGLFWVIGIVGLSGLAYGAYGIPKVIFQYTTVDETWLVYLLWAFQFVGKIYSACTYIAIVVNYSIQCEFLIYAIESLYLQLNERIPYLKDAMHEILRLRELISRLNTTLSKMASMCIMNFGLKTVIGLCILITMNDLNGLQLIHRIMYPLIYLPMMLFPLIQAGRMTKVGQKIQRIALEARIFGYKTCSQIEQDSFILFTSNATLRTKLFSVPVKPSYLISGFSLLIFTLLLLFQTNVIDTAL